MPHDTTTAIKLALLVLSLGLDTFTVAVALGMSGIGGTTRVRAGASFALFEGVMPLAGFGLGQMVSSAAGQAASSLGLLILFGAGVWVLYESMSGSESANMRVDNWKALAVTSLAVSLDELAVGFSMGALGLPIVLSAILIATQAFVVTLIGTTIGRYLADTLAERAGTAAGIVLCSLALVLAAQKVAGR